MSYNIDSTHGNELCACIQLEHVARESAQRHADRLAESVFLYEAGSDEDAEEIEPSGEGYSATTDEPHPSDVAEAPALEVTVTLLLPSGEEVSDDCTMWLMKDSYGVENYDHGGSPLDGWMGSNLLATIRKMHDKPRDAAIEVVRQAAREACNATR